MPPIFVWALGAAGGALLTRWVLREAKRINRELDEARRAQTAEAVHAQPVPRLRRDPATGTYRPE